jgi:tetratricopeptide (TPR) repeat protein
VEGAGSMNARNGPVSILLTLAALLGFSSCSLAYDASRLYRAGRLAATEGRPAKAVVYLTQAIAQRPQEGGNVTLYGTTPGIYLPHFYLGLAFFNLGQYALAIEAWKNSEEQGAVQKALEYRELREKRDLFLHEIFPGIVQARRGELAEATTTIASVGDLIGALQAVGDERGDLGLRYSRVTETLTEAGKALDAGEKEQDIEQIEESREAVSGAQVEAARLLREAQGRVAVVTPPQVDAGLSAFRTALDTGGCQRDVLARLTSLRQLAVFRPDLRSKEREVRLSLGLARAYLQCGEVEPAAQNLMSIPQGAAPADETALLERELAEMREKQLRTGLEDFAMRDAILAGFTEPAAVIDAGACDQDAIQRLQLAAETVRQREDRRQLGAWISERAGIPYIPQLYLAKAFKSCGEIQKADRSLNSSKERLETLSFGYELEAEHIESWIREEQVKNLYSGSYALVLLASEYDHWDPLPGVAAEEKEIREKLSKIGFLNPRIVSSPTKKILENSVKQFIASFGKGAGNRLLIYFAGHGETLTPRYEGKTAPLGYLVPKDAAREPIREEDFNAFIDSAVGMEEIKNWAEKIESRHAMFILDSCYSGIIFQDIYTNGGAPPAVFPAAARERVRYFLTAGSANQKVPDTGVFLHTLLGLLTGEMDTGLFKNDILLSSELCVFLRRRDELIEAGISPQCGPMPPPYNQGDVIFFKPQTESQTKTMDPAAHAAAEALQADLAYWKTATRSGSAADYRGYIERFPKGRFAGLAQYRLLKLSASE